MQAMFNKQEWWVYGLFYALIIYVSILMFVMHKYNKLAYYW